MDSDPTVAALREAIESGDADAIDRILERLDAPGERTFSTVPLELLNGLLVCPGHRYHQRVARALQDRADPSSVAFVCRVVDQGFESLAYTGSDDDVIAKWLSWVLAAIGTQEAIDALARFSQSANAEVAHAMQYRLSRLR